MRRIGGGCYGPALRIVDEVHTTDLYTIDLVVRVLLLVGDRGRPCCHFVSRFQLRHAECYLMRSIGKVRSA